MFVVRGASKGKEYRKHTAHERLGVAQAVGGLEELGQGC